MASERCRAGIQESWGAGPGAEGNGGHPVERDCVRPGSCDLRWDLRRAWDSKSERGKPDAHSVSKERGRQFAPAMRMV